MGIRLDPSDRVALEELAERWHLNAADIVRMAIKSLLANAEENGGKIELPYTFKPLRARSVSTSSEKTASESVTPAAQAE